MSDARNAVEEYVAAVTTGEGTSMPESVMFAEKGNKVYAFTYTQQGGVEAVDEQGKKIETDFATTVAAYEQELVSTNVIKARSESETVDMFNAAKNGGINTVYRNYAAISDANDMLFVERTMLNNLGFDNMVITLSYVPQASLTQNAETVYDDTYANGFSVNGVAQSGNFATVINNAPAGATVRMYQNATVSSALMIGKDLTIDGNGHELKFTSGNRGIRLNHANGTEVELTLKNLTITGGASFERAVQIDSGADANNRKTAEINIENCNITATTYACNFCNYTTVDLTIKDSYIKGWAAINAYGIGNKIRVYNSTLYGLNNKGRAASNAFATVCCEGDYRVEAEPGASKDYDIVIEDSVIVAEQTTGNSQAFVGFNQHAFNCTVTVKNCDLKSNDVGGSAGEAVLRIAMYTRADNCHGSFQNCTFNTMTEWDEYEYHFSGYPEYFMNLYYID